MFKNYSKLILSVALVGAFFIGLNSVNAQASSCIAFTSNLSLGSNDTNYNGPVSQLQTFLMARGFLVMPSGVPFGYFGNLTRAAVAAFQNSNGITPAVGYVGPITRAKIAALTCVQSNVPAPIFTTDTATNISSNSATLNATISGLMDIHNGVGQSSYFEYGTYSTNLNLTSSSSGAIQGTLSKTINGLQSNTTYYFRTVINYGPNSVPANSHQYGNIMSFKTTDQISSACNSNSATSIKVLSPNGGQLWTIGQTYSVNWSTCNAPVDSWVRLSYSIPSGVGNIHYTQECFGGGQVPASQGNYNWTISSSVFGCSDAGYTFPPNTSFQTKVKTELYTGTPACDGFPPPNAPCLTGTRTLHAQDESDNNFTVTASQNNPSVTVVSPNGGETLTIGQPYTFRWTGTNLPAGSVLRLSLINGPSNGEISSLLPSGNNTATFNIPNHVAQGDVLTNLQPGSYKLKADLYDHSGCIGFCPPEPNPPRLLTSDESNASFTVTDQTMTGCSGVDYQGHAVSCFTPGLANVSSRAQTLSGDNVAISGFIIGGSGSKQVIIRGMGPSLTNFALTGVLADPLISLYGNSGLITSNNNWKDSQQSQIQATGLAPGNDLESGILVTLNPGVYTVILKGNDGGTGTGLVEVYDISGTAELTNVSTRGMVSGGDNVLISGMIVKSVSDDPQSSQSFKPFLFRGLGPSLSSSGLSGVLSDPTISLYNSSGTLIGFNNNWQDSQASDIQATGMAPSNANESAIYKSLTPGLYTVIMRSANNATGLGLMEIYKK